MELLGIFYGHLVYFSTIGYILWSFGIHIIWSFGIDFPFWYADSRKSGNHGVDCMHNYLKRILHSSSFS
jgi:hypothetical protein